LQDEIETLDGLIPTAMQSITHARLKKTSFLQYFHYDPVIPRRHDQLLAYDVRTALRRPAKSNSGVLGVPTINVPFV
jgi:hypothetical protein